MAVPQDNPRAQAKAYATLVLESRARGGVVRFRVRTWRETFLEQEQTITHSNSPWGAWRIRNENDGVPIRRRYFGGGCRDDVPGVGVTGRGPGDSGHYVFEAEPGQGAGDCADARARGPYRGAAVYFARPERANLRIAIYAGAGEEALG